MTSFPVIAVPLSLLFWKDAIACSCSLSGTSWRVLNKSILKSQLLKQQWYLELSWKVSVERDIIIEKWDLILTFYTNKVVSLFLNLNQIRFKFELHNNAFAFECLNYTVDYSHDYFNCDWKGDVTCVWLVHKTWMRWRCMTS